MIGLLLLALVFGDVLLALLLEGIPILYFPGLVLGQPVRRRRRRQVVLGPVDGAADNAGHDGTIIWKEMVWDRPGSVRKVNKELAKLLTQAVNNDGAVGDLRDIVADFKAVTHPRQVMIIAEHGSRPGPLAGERWSAKKIHESWRCQHIVICVAPRFVELHWQDPTEVHSQIQTYVVHPTDEEWAEELPAEYLKSYVAHDVLHNIGQNGSPDFEPHPFHITNCDMPELGQHADWVTFIQGGMASSKYRLELTDDAAAIFAANEAWLRAPTGRWCVACPEHKRVLEMPTWATAGRYSDAMCRKCQRREMMERDRLRGA